MIFSESFLPFSSKKRHLIHPANINFSQRIKMYVELNTSIYGYDIELRGETKNNFLFYLLFDFFLCCVFQFKTNYANVINHPQPLSP